MVNKGKNTVLVAMGFLGGSAICLTWMLMMLGSGGISTHNSITGIDNGAGSPSGGSASKSNRVSMNDPEKGTLVNSNRNSYPKNSVPSGGSDSVSAPERSNPTSVRKSTNSENPPGKNVNGGKGLLQVLSSSGQEGKMLGDDRQSSRDGAFFKEEDIAKEDEDWGKKVCPLRELTDMSDFYDYINTRRLSCEKPVMLGGFLRINESIIVGEKWVCMSPKFNVKPRNCVALSFGISTDWSFDDAIDNKYDCKVYAFDPFIHKEDHNRSVNIRFFNKGISNKLSVKMDRYVNILRILGLENEIIDYLKLDVEGNELAFFADVLHHTPNLLKKVKMLSMEIHQQGGGLGQVQKSFWQAFQILDCFGFKIWFSEINPVKKLMFKWKGEMQSCCYEIVWARDRQW